MKKNVGSIDRVVRILLAIVFAVLAFAGGFGETAAIIFGVLAVVMLGTSLMSWCPIYMALKLSSIKKQQPAA